MCFLCVFGLLGIYAGLGAEVIGAVHFRDLCAGRRHSLCRQIGGIGAHIGDVSAFIQALRGPHGARGGKAQFAAAFLLQTFEFEGRAPILLKSGRFGPYLTDGERNATLRKGEEEDTLTAERALEILEERGKEPKGKPAKPAKKAAGTAKAGAKKTASATKKAPAKASATKAAGAKKAPAKRAASNTAAAKASAAVPAKVPLTWAELKPHLAVLSDQERQLVTATRERGQKVEDVAPTLGLDVKKAKGMALQASKKLNQAARAE